jgi:hypothetical protein
MELLNRRRRTRRRELFGLVCCMGVLAACIGTSPEQAAREALGPDTGRFEEGPNHRAGFACLACHGPDGSPEGSLSGPAGGVEIVLGGTVYGQAGDRYGAQDVEVVIRDDANHEISVHSNRAGNFYLTRGGGSTPQSRGHGEVSIPWPLEYPLSIRVRSGADEQSMRGLIWREGSCAVCHDQAPSATSNGRVFVRGAGS